MGRSCRWGLFTIALLHVTCWRCSRVQPLDWLGGASSTPHAASFQRGDRYQREARGRNRGPGAPPPVILDEAPEQAEDGKGASKGQAGGQAADGDKPVARKWWDLQRELKSHKNAKHWKTVPDQEPKPNTEAARNRWMRRVLGCQTLKNVQQLMKGGMAEWPPGALALAWHRAVKLGTKGQMPAIHKTEGRLAEELRQRNLYSFEALDLALIVYSWGVSRYSESGKVLKSLMKNVIERLDEQSPTQLANMVYGMGRLGNRARVVGDFLGGVCSLMTPEMLPRLKPQEIANTVWGMSKLLYLRPGFLRDVSEFAAERLEYFKAQDIASLVYSMHRLGFRHPGLMLAVCEETPARFHEFSPRQVNNLIHALGQMQVKHSGFTMAMTEHVGRRVKELKDDEQIEGIQRGLEVLQSL